MIIDLTIIIVNYRSWGKLKNCIKSIQNQSHINTQIIVVDNFSNDNKFKHFQNEYKQINWIENKNNLGFAKACNIGALKAESKWLLFLNPDTILEKNSLSSLIKYSISNKEHRLIGIKQLDQNGSNTNAYGLFLNIWTSRVFHQTYATSFQNDRAHGFWFNRTIFWARKIHGEPPASLFGEKTSLVSLSA